MNFSSINLRATVHLFLKTLCSIKHTLRYKNFLEIKIYLKKLKLRWKNTIIDKTLTHATETWILTKRVRKQTFLKGKCTEEF